MPLFTRGATSGVGQQLPPPDKWRAALEAAMKVSEIASSALPLDAAVGAIVRSAVALMKAEQGSIMLVDDAEGSLILAGSAGLPPEVRPGHRVPIGESVSGRVLATGKPLLLGEVDHDAFVNFVPKARAISSSMVVPLRAQGESIGVLSLGMSSAAAAFTTDDLRVAQMLADLAAGVIHRARLHEQAEHRSADLLALADAGKSLLGALDLDALLQQVLEGGLRIAGCKDGFAALFDPESGAISRGVFRGLDKAAIRELVERPEVQQASERGEVETSGDPAAPFVAVGLTATAGMRGVLVGVGEAITRRNDFDLLRAFSRQCNTALGAARLHSELERARSQMTAIINGVPHPIVVVDAKHNVAGMNPAAEQVFGVSLSFSTGHPVTSTFEHPVIQALLLGSDEMEDEVVIGTPPHTFKARAVEVRGAGSVLGRALIMDDITTEREIIQTHRDFVAMIGHELRTPLTIIKGFARTLLRRVEKGNLAANDVRDSLATIDARSSQLERLIEDLLYVSRIETREAKLRIEDVAMRALVENVAHDVLQDHPGRNVQIDIPEDLAWRCDETKMALVLRHLVDNGLKYSSAPEVVTVRSIVEPNELVLEVVDRGVGIVSQDLPRVFDRFRQIDSTSTRSHGGTGVGLYLCSQLVRMHDGKITADSIWGKGSTFSIVLPRRPGPEDFALVEVPERSSAL